MRVIHARNWRAAPIQALAAALFWATTLCAQAEGTAVESITWLKSESPTSKAFLSTFGTVDPMIAFIKQRTPQIEHRILTANAKRSWQMIRGGEQVCIASAIRNPERDRWAYFSDTDLAPALRLIVRNDKVAQLPMNKHGEVELGQLLVNGHLRGAVVDQRSYGPYIDLLLAEQKGNKAIAVLVPSDFGGQVLQMIALDRVDYTIEFHQAMRVIEDKSQALTSFAIAGVPELMPVGVACPRNGWGLAAIQLIDSQLSTPAGVTMLKKTHARWASADEMERSRAKYEAFFKNRSRPTQFAP